MGQEGLDRVDSSTLEDCPRVVRENVEARDV